MIESGVAPRNMIGGEWVPADSGEAAEVRNPACPSQSLGATPVSGTTEASRAVGAAVEALGGWKATLPASRGEILLRAADLIDSKAEKLAHLMAREAGKPLKEGRVEAARAANIFRYYGSEGWRMPGAMPPLPGRGSGSVRSASHSGWSPS